MLPNNNYMALPFYTSVAQQEHRRYAEYVQTPYPLRVSDSKLIPFQLFVGRSSCTINAIEIYDIDDNLVAPITTPPSSAGVTWLTLFTSSGLVTETDGSSNYFITHRSSADFHYRDYTATIPIGLHYMVIVYTVGPASDTTYLYYSEVFEVVPDNALSQCIKIAYYNTSDMSYENNAGNIHFNSSYPFYLYINALIAKPQYDMTQEVTERNGYNFIEKSVSKKIFNFSFLAPEYLCDALRLVWLCDNITITQNDRTWDTIDKVVISPEWLDEGNLAAIEFEFSCDTIIVEIPYTTE